MLVGLYLALTRVVIPQLGAYLNALLAPVMTIVIILFGLIMVFGAVGIKISENLGSTIFGGIFRGIGFLVRTAFNAIRWIVTRTLRMIPRLFVGSRNAYATMGAGMFLRNLLATITVIIVVAVII